MRTITSAINPVYTNAQGTGIDVIVTFAELAGSFPFHATSTDPESYGQQLYSDLQAGKYGAIAPYVFDPVTASANIRQLRNALLAETDWSQGSDIPSATKTKWEPYRQALRDVPQQAGFPTNVTWPTPPN